MHYFYNLINFSIFFIIEIIALFLYYYVLSSDYSLRLIHYFIKSLFYQSKTKSDTANLKSTHSSVQTPQTVH